MRLLALSFPIALLAFAGPLAAQDPAPAAPAAAATPTAGAAVFDPAGEQVGTIESVSGGNAVLAIDATNKIGLPLTSIGTGEKGLAISLTKADLMAAVDKAKADTAAQLKAQLIPGAAVRSLNGSTEVGTVKEADDSFVTLTTPKGDVRLPATAFAMGATGPIIGMSAADFDAAISGVTQ